MIMGTPAPAPVPVPTFPDGGLYTWSQSNDQVVIAFPVSRDLTSSMVKITFSDKALLCVIEGEPQPRVKGQLFRPIKRNDSIWQLEKSQKNGNQLLTIHLEKAHEGVTWPMVVTAGLYSELDMDPHSMYILASLTQGESEVSQNCLDLFTKAAELDSIPAQLKLAAWYEIGQEESPSIPFRQDRERSLLWHTRAAQLGNSEACYIVGTVHVQGTHGASKSYSAGLEWFNRCIVSDPFLADTQPNIFVAAAFQSGLLLMEGGNGLGDPDPARAAGFWQKTSKMGHPQSAWNLGIFYLNGFGVEQDIREAVRLITIAMSLDPNLALPPQLQSLQPSSLPTLVRVAEEAKATGIKPDLDSLVSTVLAREIVASAGGQAGETAALHSQPLTTAERKRATEQTQFWLSVATGVAAVAVGSFILFRYRQPIVSALGLGSKTN
ncbi:uncharacterized protein BJ171DRAFT_512400 [Polychytrium aggregatum]|uniref:uncharacterized protein n=1 Tax=Polychytrium aggregatum TaxID=110093 RepID=UPI0022FEC924|nr:uncharacterized protein BJ171DRAFT_512400 [Polychytrium aggregatum]KAI9202864.1 hypothetical protein BJ171DRAFT_512400 [Polychytrium aggregatum]